MNAQEVAALLAVVSTYDRRALMDGEVHAWHGALGDLRFEECRDAVVKHYGTATDWVMPAHLRRLVTAARQDAAMRELPGHPDDLVPMPSWFHVVVTQHKTQTREANRLARDEGRPVSYGTTVTRPSDYRPAGGR